MTTKENTMEDWNTIWPHLHDNNFKPPTGPVRPGPIKPLKTDFINLTDQQRQVLAQENRYWAEVEAMQQGKATITVTFPNLTTSKRDVTVP